MRGFIASILVRASALALLLGAFAAPATAADARAAWQNLCVRCHGADGKGDTKMGRKLRIKDLTRPRVQARLTEDRVAEAVLDGLEDNDGKEQMPSFRDKLSEGELKALIAHVRALKSDD